MYYKPLLWDLLTNPTYIKAQAIFGWILHFGHPCTQGCTECSGTFPNCQEAFTDGSGVDDADIVIYVSAFPDSSCEPESGVFAIAAPCQLEDVLDRYICAYSTCLHELGCAPIYTL